MQVSMNGFRRNLSGNVKELREVTQAIIKDDWYEKEDLITAVNQVIRDSNVLNCIYYKDDPDFSEMGDVEVELLDEEVE